MRRVVLLSALLSLALALAASAQIFTNVAPQLGVDVTTPWGDAFAVDFNGDDANDILYVSRYDGPGYYFQYSNGAYELLDIGLPQTDCDPWKVIPVDFDRDTDLDLIMCAYHYSSLYFENVNGHMVNRTAQMGITTRTWGRDVAVADLNRDGWMDILIGYADIGWKAYQNNGGQSFTDVSDALNLPMIEDFHRFCETDVDLDGDVDLFMTTLDGDDRFFLNVGGVFEDRTDESGLAEAVGRGGCLWADFDNDKLPDLLVGGELNHTIWHNDGNATFSELNVHGTAVVFNIYPYTAAYAAADFDMDGDLDVFAGQPGGGWWGLKPNQFFRCDSIVGRDVYFTDIAPELNMDDEADSRPHFFDFDQDGDLDLFLRMYGEPSRLYRNNLSPGNRLLVSVVGPEYERDCWMTRVEVYEHGTETLVSSAETNYGGARRDGLDHYFTLDANGAYDLRVYFADGEAMLPETYDGLSNIVPAQVNGKLIIRRGVGVEQATSVRRETPVPQAFSVTAYPNPFNPATSISLSLPSAANIRTEIFDVQGRLVSTLVNEFLSAGEHRLQWNAETFATGVYILRVSSPAHTKSMKLMLLK